MARKIERLTDRTVRAKKDKGYYADGDGLYLQVTATGAKSWVFRFKRKQIDAKGKVKLNANGKVKLKARDMGLGGYPRVSLDEARQKAKEARQHRDEKKDPITERDAAEAKQRLADESAVTFKKFAEDWIDTNEGGWKNAKHRQQWRNTLAQYVYPVFGDMPVSDVDTDLVLKIIQPIWATKTETAARVRGRIEAILKAAIARKLRPGPNPAVWRGHLEALLPKKSMVHRVTHHAAMPYKELPAFMARLRATTGVIARALEVTILTGLRTKEAIGAEFDEFDLVEKVWSVPPERMKGRRKGDAPFRVPLSDRVIAIVKELADTKRNNFVFPGLRPEDKHLYENYMLLLLQEMVPSVTTHGFRSTFRDWAEEQTTATDRVCEYALSHMPKSKVVKAYLRADLLEKRRPLMERWADYCEGRDNVIPMRAA